MTLLFLTAESPDRSGLEVQVLVQRKKFNATQLSSRVDLTEPWLQWMQPGKLVALTLMSDTFGCDYSLNHTLTLWECLLTLQV